MSFHSLHNLSISNLKMLEHFCNGLVEGALIVDAHHFKVLGANNIAVKTLHTDLPYLIGSDVFEWFKSPEDICFWEELHDQGVMHLHSDTLLTTQYGHTIEVERQITHISIGDVSVYFVVFYNHSNQRKVEYDLEKLIADLRSIFDSITEGILVTDLKGTIRNYNQQFAKIWELPFDLITSRDDSDIYQWISQHIHNIEQYFVTQEQIKRDPRHEGVDILHLHNGHVVERTTLAQYARGQVIGRIYSFKNITQQHEDALHLKLTSKVFEASLDGVIITDPQFNIITVNQAANTLCHEDPRCAIGMPVFNIFVANGSEFSAVYLNEILHQQGFWAGNVIYYQANGDEIQGQLNVVRILDSHKDVSHHVIFFRDISDKVRAQNRIEELAYTDMLTGLPNRLRLIERMEYMLPLAKRRKEEFAVAILDLDRFKNINDSLGHDVGDRVLIDIGKRLKLCVREVDMVARIGGDEFVLLLNQTTHQGIELVLDRVLEQLSVPITIGEFVFSLGGSLGVAVYPEDGSQSMELIKNAETAMYRLKDHGKTGYRFFQPQMNIEMLAKVKLDQAMRTGLRNGEFQLYYQPQFDLQTKVIVGVEALIRWHHPVDGMISPVKFIPLAEETGFIVSLGQWVLNTAFMQAAQWYREGKPLRVSINVSGIQFQQANFIELVQQLLTQHNLPAKYIELELTESVLVKDKPGGFAKTQCLDGTWSAISYR